MTNKPDRRILKWSMRLSIIALLLFITVSQAYGLGVAPSRKIINWEPEISVTSRVVNNAQQDMNVVIYAQGEYAEYVTIDQAYLTLSASESEKEFSYKVRLPSNATPGSHTIHIVVMELPDKTGGKTNVMSTISIEQELILTIPYPGKFAEGILYIDEGNINETITFTANIINRGTETINDVHGTLVIKGPTNEELYRIDSNSIASLNSKAADKLIVSFLANMNPGVYYAEFIVYYEDKMFVLRKVFTVGNLNLEITAIDVPDFRLGFIARTDIELLSRWNQPLEVYSDIQLLDQQGNQISTFKTASVDVQPLSKGTLSGYWDTKGLEVGEYDIKVILYYSGKTVEKIFKAVIGIDSVSIQGISTGKVIEKPGDTGGGMPLLYALVIGLVILNIFLVFVYFKYIRKKNPPEKM